MALIRFVWFGFVSFLVLKNDIQWAWVKFWIRVVWSGLGFGGIWAGKSTCLCAVCRGAQVLAAGLDWSRLDSSGVESSGVGVGVTATV